MYNDKPATFSMSFTGFYQTHFNLGRSSSVVYTCYYISSIECITVIGREWKLQYTEFTWTLELGVLDLWPISKLVVVSWTTNLDVLEHGEEP